MLPVAVLSGGLATRLLPATAALPKALLSVAGRPFLHWQLSLLAQQGITQVVLCVGHLGEQIRTAVGDGAGFGLTVRYSFDGEMLLGTGGALKRALPLLGSAFFVLYGDSYLPCCFAHVQSAYAASGAPALMTVCRNENRWDASNVLFREDTIVEYNKRSPRPEMAHVDFGLSVLSAQVLGEYPPGSAFELGDVYHELARRGVLAGLEVPERFYEIGSVAGLAAAEHYLTRQGRA
jgi:N-acetyl-alpha-D-muramate 1-phosphate uridylyltransferase